MDELRQHMAQLEGQGALQLAADAEAWLRLGDPGLRLPAYFEVPPGVQHSQQPEIWLAPTVAPMPPEPAAERCQDQGTRGADDCADAWQALEEQGGGAAAAAWPESTACQQLSGHAGSVTTAFDDGQLATAACGQHVPPVHQPAAQHRLTDLWERVAAGGKPEPDHWAQLAGCNLEAEATSAVPQPPVAAGTGGMPSSAAAPPQEQQEQERVSDSEGDWGPGELAAVAELEQAALALQEQPGQMLAPLATQQLRAPVLRHRSFATQHLQAGQDDTHRGSDCAAAPGSGMAEGIEESGSEGEPTLFVEQVAAKPAALRRAGTIPAIGRRAALRLAPGAVPPAAAALLGPQGSALAGGAGAPDASQPLSQHAQPEPSRHLAQQAAPAADRPAPPPASPLDLAIDFATVDVSSLRPTVLLRWASSHHRPD